MSNQDERKSKRIVSMILNVILVLAILLFAYVSYTVITAEDKDDISFFGYRPALILTGSMDPEIKQYGIVLLKDCEYEDVQVGDVVAYTYDDKNIVHEVIDITDEGLITKGTNNDTADPYPVTEEMVYAEVVWSTNILNTIIYNPTVITLWGVLIASTVAFIIILRRWLRIRKQT